MKSLTVLLPLAVLVSGCSAPAAENNTASTNTVTGAAPAPAVEEKRTYKVVSEVQPGMSDEMAEAVRKTAVAPPPDDFQVPDSPKLVLTTSKGNITVELDSAAAPLHVKSFVYLASKKFFDGTIFHRYEPGFVIQGGDPLTRDPKTRAYAGIGGPGYQIPREVNHLQHDKYVLAAARSSDPDSAGSQFYFTLEPSHFLDSGYTVFGKVVAGQDVVSKLRQLDVLKHVDLVKAAK